MPSSLAHIHRSQQPGRRSALGVLTMLGALLGATLLLVPGGALAATGAASVGFGVSPMRVDLEVKPGASVTRSIRITNTDTSPMTFTFGKEDFAGDKDEPAATPVLLGGRFASAISGYDWIELPSKVTIPAGQSRSVAVKVNVPTDATGGHYTAVMVSGEQRRAGRLTAQSRIGVLFLLNAGGVPPPEIVITEVREAGPTRTVTEFINRGSTHTTPRGTITKDPVGPGKTRRIKGECTTALPGGSGECVFDDPEGARGGSAGGVGGLLPVGPVEQYVDIVGDPGGEDTAARGELPTTWAGTWTSMLLPLVGLALFVLYFLFLRRRRKDDEEQDGGGLDGDGSELARADGY